MSRFAAGVRTAAGSTTLPIISVYSATAINFRLREVGLANTTTTAVAQNLRRLTTAGTQGTGITEASYDSTGAASSVTAFTTHTGNPTLGDDLGYRTTLGAAAGAGVIWTMTATGIIAPVGTGNGTGVIVSTGTGQVTDAYMVWDE